MHDPSSISNSMQLETDILRSPGIQSIKVNALANYFSEFKYDLDPEDVSIEHCTTSVVAHEDRETIVFNDIPSTTAVKSVTSISAPEDGETIAFEVVKSGLATSVLADRETIVENDTTTAKSVAATSAPEDRETIVENDTTVVKSVASTSFAHNKQFRFTEEKTKKTLYPDKHKSL